MGLEFRFSADATELWPIASVVIIALVVHGVGADKRVQVLRALAVVIRSVGFVLASLRRRERTPKELPGPGDGPRD